LNANKIVFSSGENLKAMHNEALALYSTAMIAPVTQYEQSRIVSPLPRGVTGDADYDDAPGKSG
jgi:hypothetical protein